MVDFKETAISYLNIDDYAIFHSSEQKWINKILKLRESHPDEVKIVYLPEDNNGMLLAHVPKSWFKVSPPAKRNMTDEQRKATAARLANSRAKRNG
jgi:hypothetical protein